MNLWRRYILETQVDIDINTFVTYLEKLVSVAIVHGRLQHFGDDSGLHNITLPRSWLVSTLGHGIIRSSHWAFIMTLIDPLALFLEDVYNCSGK